MDEVIGEKEYEVKVLDLTEEDIARVDAVIESMGGKKVSEFPRRIRTLDNGLSKEKDQLLRITDEEGHAKLSLHTNQSNVDKKGHYKAHMSKSDRIIQILGVRYGEKVITDVVAPRISYEIGEGEENCIDLDIDRFPAIPPFMEVDLANLSKQGYTLPSLLSALGLENHRCVVCGTEDIHTLYGVDYFEVYATDTKELSAPTK